MMDVASFVAAIVSRWEGGYSSNPNDAGNWYEPKTGVQSKGIGALYGSNRGVTAKTLTAYLGRSVTVADVKAITLAQAVDISTKLFYRDTGLANLAWNPVTASVLDFAWGAGPTPAKKLLQDMLDVTQDGIIGVGGATAKSFAAFCSTYGFECAAGAWWSMREEFYEALVIRRPSDQQFIHGWDNRSGSMLPGHHEGWWAKFLGKAVA